VTIKERLDSIQQNLTAHCKLIVVSKYRTRAEIEEVYQTGQRIFAENRVQNLVERRGELPEDIEWHLIGQLQTNKVKYIASFVAMIHSLDSIKLAEEIQKQAIKHNRIIPCLIQLHIAQEESKSGLHPDELDTFLKDPIWSSLNRVQISGVMSMATLTDDQDLIRSEFRKTREIFETLKKLYFKDNPHFKQISMGMSSDYQIAAEEGSSMVRIGSLVFGG
jgi:hypothetical protein